MKSVLSLDRYKTLLAAYGARLELWPEAERAAAEALLASSEEARSLAAAEAGFDALFAGHGAPEISPALSRKLGELPVVHPQPRKLWPFRRVWLPAVAWAAAALFGIAIGSLAPDPDGGQDSASADATFEATQPSTTSAAAEPADDEEDQFFEMALGSVDLEELP